MTEFPRLENDLKGSVRVKWLNNAGIDRRELHNNGNTAENKIEPMKAPAFCVHKTHVVPSPLRSQRQLKQRRHRRNKNSQIIGILHNYQITGKKKLERSAVNAVMVSFVKRYEDHDG